MLNKRFKYEPDYAVLPGDTLLETLEYFNISQAEFAQRTGRPLKTINGIIKGYVAITPESALQFEKVLGVPASFWINLESNYQEQIARQRERDTLAQQINWLNQIPIRDLIKNGWIKDTEDKIACIQEVLSFFGVASVDAWRKNYLDPQVSYRKSAAFKTDPVVAAAWLRKGEIEALKIECKDYNEARFTSALKEIRLLTVKSPDVFESKMVQLCAESGVALTFIKELPKCPVCGATRWLSPKKALIEMTLRYKSNDHFWFTFFHEAGHIIKHGKRDVFIDVEKVDNNDIKEAEANKFARDLLIDPISYKKFTNSNKVFSEVKVKDFAEQIGIAPGIVVGRLQHDGKLPYSYLNKLKTKFIWA